MKWRSENSFIRKETLVAQAGSSAASVIREEKRQTALRRKTGEAALRRKNRAADRDLQPYGSVICSGQDAFLSLVGLTSTRLKMSATM